MAAVRGLDPAWVLSRAEEVHKAVMLRLTSTADQTPLPHQAGDPAAEGAPVSQYAWRGAWVAAAHGAYDLDSITPLETALRTAARQHSKVVLDAFADSTLLNLLILTHQAGTLRLAAPSQPLQRICKITGVDTLLEIRQTVDDAALF